MSEIISATGNLQAGDSKLSGEGIVQQALLVIEQKDTIPVDAKKAIREFLIEKQQEIMANLEDLIHFDMPEVIADHWTVVVEIIQTIANII